jgi:hypothetical protein
MGCFASASLNWLMPKQRPLPGVWKWMKATLDHGGFVVFEDVVRRGRFRWSAFSKEEEESSAPLAQLLEKRTYSDD